jgi:hypothetical protein
MAAEAQVSQVVVEGLVNGPSEAYIAQVSVLALVNGSSEAQVSQVAIEVLVEWNPNQRPYILCPVMG